MATNRRKEQLVELVHDATADIVAKLHCPACSGSLNIQFAPRGARGKGAGSLSVMCPQCPWRIIADGIPKTPPWVAELGSKIDTAAKPAVPQHTHD